MAEPTTVNYPSSYEDNTTLLGPLGERRTAVVKTSISVASLQITFEEPLTGLTGPLAILFEGGEIWWVEADGITVADDDTIISLDSLEQRAFHNSILQPHTAGEEAYFTVISTHINQYKKGIEALQQNGFLLGTTAEKTVYESSAIAGEGWLESDTGKVYYCFSAGTFVWVNYLSHSDLAGLEDDDHDTGTYAYHTDGRADTWHGLLSESHILSGDDHDHFSANEGNAVLRIYGGLDASKGSPSYPGQLYFATDTSEGGTLYISSDGINWDKISGAPTDAIAAYAGACPSGWSRYTNLDGKYLYVDNTSPGSGGGANTHQHDYSAIREHYHGMVSPATSSQTNPGNHSHQWRHHSGSGSDSRRAQISDYSGYVSTSGVGGFSHTVTVPATTSSQTGVVSPQTSVDNNEPPYKELVWCKKD